MLPALASTWQCLACTAVTFFRYGVTLGLCCSCWRLRLCGIAFGTRLRFRFGRPFGTLGFCCSAMLPAILRTWRRRPFALSAFFCNCSTGEQLNRCQCNDNQNNTFSRNICHGTPTFCVHILPNFPSPCNWRGAPRAKFIYN